MSVFACEINVDYIYPNYDTNQMVIVNEEQEQLDFSFKFTDKNQSIKYEIKLTNTCSDNLKINNITLSNSKYDMFIYSFDGIKMGDILLPNESKIVNLLFNIKSSDESLFGTLQM